MGAPAAFSAMPRSQENQTPGAAAGLNTPRQRAAACLNTPRQRAAAGADPMSGRPILGFYGGSFDPIHGGHLAPVEDVRQRLGLDAVYFVPAFHAPHKPSGPSAPAAHRFAMVALALMPFDRLILSDDEVAREGKSYTIDTLARFESAFPGSEIVLVLGTDTLVTLSTWREWRRIVSNHRIAVVHREPYERDLAALDLPEEIRVGLAREGVSLRAAPPSARVFPGGNAAVTISSTWIRDAAANGEDLESVLPREVARYLRKQGLYRRA